MISSQYCSFFFSSNLVLQLELTNTCAYSCHKRVQYGSVVSHIIGDIHCERVARNLQEQQDVDSVSVEGDEAVVSDDTTGQAKIPALLDYDRMPLDAADGKKKSATKQKASKKKADKMMMETAKMRLLDKVDWLLMA